MISSDVMRGFNSLILLSILMKEDSYGYKISNTIKKMLTRDRPIDRLPCMKLSQWAKEKGISYQTAYRMFQAGTLPVKSEQLPTGTILVFPEDVVNETKMTIESRLDEIISKLNKIHIILAEKKP